ncbi:MAG TPA: hypothetical protein VNJ01_03035 [Bacteriovoracaceae bacterium]|nr:hypothetical protein [Bacteriovoracaceae bacterium]
MNKIDRPIAILNLSGELIAELADYFESRKILVVNPLVQSVNLDWTHIITKDLHDFSLLDQTYGIRSKGISLVSLTQVNDVKNFVTHNGHLVLDELWVKSSFGNLILDKFLQGYGGIELGDNYPTFKEQGSFNVTNPFSTGDYLDRLVSGVLGEGFDGLAIRTFLDHLIMYLAGLKAKSKVGMPIEVTYGSFEGVLGVQLHFFAQDILLEDVTAGLSSRMTKRAQEYYLNISVQSADFFDFAYMAEAKKIIITGLWTKDERINFENRGMMFSQLDAHSKLTQFPSLAPQSYLVSTAEITDQSSQIISASPAEAQAVTVVKGIRPGVDDALQVIKQEQVDSEEETLSFPEEESAPEEFQVFSSQEEIRDIVSIVRGKFDEEKSVIRIESGKLDVEKFAYKIAAGLEAEAKDKNLVLKSLPQKLPEAIKNSLGIYATASGKSINELSNLDLENFKLRHLPEMVQKIVVDGDKDAAIVSVKLKAENDRLKLQVKSLSLELKLSKEARNQLAVITDRATSKAAEMKLTKTLDPSETLRKEFQKKLDAKVKLDEFDSKRLAQLLEEEGKLISDARDGELRAKKIQIELLQKEAIFQQELERTQKQIKAKDTMLIKSKETFNRQIGAKTAEIEDLYQNVEQLTKALAAALAQDKNGSEKNLEALLQNLPMAAELPELKNPRSENILKANVELTTLKDDLRRMQISNTNLKNQLEMSKKEMQKLNARMSADHTVVLGLRQEKAKLEQQLKKTTTAVAREKSPVASISEAEHKRLQSQNQVLETQLKDSTQKINHMESKLIDLMKQQKPASSGDESSKVKINHLEASVKKLTQDIVESRNQNVEMKKEINKLRQEKTGQQNLIEKLKKDSSKEKGALPKKNGGGKAA